MDYKMVMQSIREQWFPDHRADLERLSDNFAVLTWAKSGTSVYSVRYVFDGNKIYITGDTGEAVVVLTENAQLDRLAKYDLGYFAEKLRCLSSGKYSFCPQDANAEIEQHLIEGQPEKIRETGIRLVSETKSCHSIEAWRETLNDFFRVEIEDNGWYKWIYSCGDAYSHRLIGYLVGLQMAHEQLAATPQ